MELLGNLGFQCEREQLWNAIYKTDSWLKAIPAAESYEQIGDNLYEMVVRVDMVVFKGDHTVKISFTGSDAPLKDNFILENELIKKAEGFFHILHPDEAPLEEGEAYPEGTASVFGYKLELDSGNPLINAALEGFKPRIKRGLEEILLRLEAQLISEQ